MNKLRLAIHWPNRDETPISLIRYAESVVAEISGRVIIEKYQQGATVHKPDIVWDPFCGWSQGPVWPEQSDHTGTSRVITFHGAAPWSMNPLEYWGDLRVAIEQELTVEKKLIWWLDRFEEIDHIIVPSRFAAWELSQYGGVRQSSISVIYHGVDPNRFYPPTAVFQRSGVLHVSSWQPKKNVSALISAFNACDALQKEGLELVLGGKDAKILAGNSKWIHIDPEIADDSRLRQKYHKSKVFVFPSFHETFGLPVLEAMACGCPVVCSDRAALKEVYADASLQVDPRDTKALAEAINAVIGDARLSTDLVERGLSLAATLTWKTSAEQHIRCFDGLR